MDFKINIAFKQCSYSKKIIVVSSHERSGTHFLMNSISKLQNLYTCDPHIDLDISLYSIYDLYFNNQIEKFFTDIMQKNCISIVKTHHPYKFFENIHPSIKNNIIFFYIYRNPIDTIKSFWHFSNTYDPMIPNFIDFIQFAMNQPQGKMLRYHHKQYKNIFLRWKDHILSWFEASRQNNNIHLVYYSNLKDNYPLCIKHISKIIGEKIINIEKPNRNKYWKPDNNIITNTISNDHLKKIQNYLKTILIEDIFKKFFYNLYEE